MNIYEKKTGVQIVNRSKKNVSFSSETAETLAIEGLGFLAGDPERLERFLALSGLDPGNLRAAAATPGFFAGVLDHISSDESLLLAFAANAGLDPQEVARARIALAGPPPDWGA